MVIGANFCSCVNRLDEQARRTAKTYEIVGYTYHVAECELLEAQDDDQEMRGEVDVDPER